MKLNAKICLKWFGLPVLAATLFATPGATTASAKLGDNEKAISSTYGKPIDQGKSDKDGLVTNLYQRGTTLILVQIKNGVVVAEAYSRSDRQPITNEQMIRFMKTNSNGQYWDAKPGSDTILIRRDKKAEARYSIIGGRPTFWVRTL